MAELSEEETILQRLKELNGSDWDDRKQAIQALTEGQLKDERILALVKVIAELDPIEVVRKIAREALGLSDIPPTAPESKEPPTEESLQELIKELSSSDPYKRGSAVQVADQQQIKDERVTVALKAISENDPTEVVWQAAQMALAGERPAAPMPKPVQQLSRNEKIRDFLIGFVGWYIINGLLWLMILQGDKSLSDYSSAFIYLPNLTIFGLNLLLLILLAFKRRWVALGVLATYATNFIVAMLLGLQFNAYCWVPFIYR